MENVKKTECFRRFLAAGSGWQVDLAAAASVTIVLTLSPPAKFQMPKQWVIGSEFISENNGEIHFKFCVQCVEKTQFHGCTIFTVSIQTVIKILQP